MMHLGCHPNNGRQGGDDFLLTFSSNLGIVTCPSSHTYLVFLTRGSANILTALSPF